MNVLEKVRIKPKQFETYLQIILRLKVHLSATIGIHVRWAKPWLPDNRRAFPTDHVSPNKINPNNLRIISFRSIHLIVEQIKKTLSLSRTARTYPTNEHLLCADCLFYCRVYRAQKLHRTLTRRQVWQTRLHHHRPPQTSGHVSQCTFPCQHHLCDKYNRPD